MAFAFTEEKRWIVVIQDSVGKQFPVQVSQTRKIQIMPYFADACRTEEEGAGE